MRLKYFQPHKMTNIDNNVPAQEPELTQEQLLALYQHAFAILEQQNQELKEVIQHQKEQIDTIWDVHTKRLIEIHKEHDATKEKLNQVTKKDEMKTALLKQLMKK
jgi:hypothetical protein